MAITVILPDGRKYNNDPNRLGLGGDIAGVPASEGSPALSPTVARTVDGVGGGGGGNPSPRNFVPTRGQTEAVEGVRRLVGKVGAAGYVITGYAGVGKTTMLKLLGAQFGCPTVLTPTGKAAVRVAEASGLKAATAHSWLYTAALDPRTNKLAFTLKPADQLRLPASRLVLVDEASMIGRSLWADIWRAVQAHSLKIVLIGDGFQLPPVEDSKGGANFSTMTDVFAKDHGFDRIELTEVLRQAQDSPVVRASMDLRNGGNVTALAELPRPERETLLDTCVSTYQAGGVIIAHTNATRHRVNQAMRYGLGLAEGPALIPGEPLMVLRNQHELELCNGEQVKFEGWATTGEPGESTRVVDPYAKVEGRFTYAVACVNGQKAVICVEALTDNLQGVGGWSIMVGAERWARARGYISNGRPLPYLEVNYGYCYTAHKSQGSEWPYALVLLEPSVRLNTEEGRRWTYTAITRAKEMAAVFYGRP